MAAHIGAVRDADWTPTAALLRARDDFFVGLMKFCLWIDAINKVWGQQRLDDRLHSTGNLHKLSSPIQKNLSEFETLCENILT